MMEAYTERMRQQCEQEALLAAQREQELLAQELEAQREQEAQEELPPNSGFHQLIEEMCSENVFAEQKLKMENMMLELLDDCQQKMIYRMHNDVDDLIEKTLDSKLLSIDKKSQHLVQEQEEVQIIKEPEAKSRNRFTPCLQNFKVITKKSNTLQIFPVNALTHDFPTEETANSLSMGDKHLDTIPETKSVKDPIPTPREFKVTSKCDVHINDEPSPFSTTFLNPLFDLDDEFSSSDDESLSNEDILNEVFKIYSNPLVDEEIIFPKIDPDSLNAESNLINSMLNRDTFIDSKFDYLLEEFSGKLTPTNPIPSGIVDTDCEPEEEVRLHENMFYENSSPEERNAEISDTSVESPSPLPIPVTNSDSQIKEIDLFFASDDSMPPGIENDDYDSEGDIHFLEELLSNDSTPLPENESSNLGHVNDPSSPHPPLEPPDVEVCSDFKPNTGDLANKAVKGIFE
ncbi:hypothetical protein Tco_0658470 [Tanacetum coccineum]